ncbi:MAG: UDP-N-acetylmuramoyl-L-alanyl-D-glutamate--2,6-diaminopimelate ligase [Defluviitaleaceae bacterium]|nr:UDP-N-acetylmuramoyl-L-alanyl-D-glutamate--2,6-diaminopimelate ligase [Defluviitaleaceae bacterium]
MKLSNLLKDIPHKIIRPGDSEILSVEIDSRKVKPGALFICQRGLTVDGHTYIGAAVKAGAAAILIEDENAAIPEGVAAVYVENSRRAAAYIAANFYKHPAKKLRLIGVTGTNGKTSVTCFIEEILRLCGRKTGLIGTNGARIGEKPMDIAFATSTTPDQLELHDIFAQMLENGVQDVVMEVSSHALALFKMEGLVFDVGVFTNLTQDHLDFHGTMENYRLAKAQLFTQSSFAVVNADDDSTPTMLAHHGNDPFLTYGIECEAHLRAIHIDYCLGCTVFDVNETAIPPQLGPSAFSMRYRLAPKGKFNIYNTLAAIGTAKVLGLKTEDIQSAVAQLSGVPGRIQSVPNDRGVNVFVDYAHSPDGLINIISSVREFTAGSVITLFGCGGDRDRLKRPIMGRIAGEMSDFCILTSDNPRTEDPGAILREIEAGTLETATPYELIENRRDAIFTGVKRLKPGDSLIIAGKGHEDYQIIGRSKHHFSDYETAVEAVN